MQCQDPLDFSHRHAHLCHYGALENGVPIDSVSKMLGHRSIKTTQIYAQITDKKISDDTKELFDALS